MKRTVKLGPRNTRQRKVILEVVGKASGPLSIADLHRRAAGTLSGIGIATVYRTVKLLLQQNRLSVLMLPTGEVRYEKHGLDHHHHFQCTGCGQVFCLDFCPFARGGRIRLPRGFQVETHNITAHGLCPECGKK